MCCPLRFPTETNSWRGRDCCHNTTATSCAKRRRSMNTARGVRKRSTAKTSIFCLPILQSFTPSPQLAVTLRQKRFFTYKSLTAGFTKQEKVDCHGLQFPQRLDPGCARATSGGFFANLIGTQRLRVLARDEQLNASAFDLILVNSYFSRETLLRVYGLDSTVCYLGVDTQLFVNHQTQERTLSSAWAN